MPISSDVDDGRFVINLQGDVDISEAAELKQALLDAILSHKELFLDLANLANVDITAVQLLWAAVHEIQKTGMDLKVIRGVPEAIKSTIFDAGFEPFLETATKPPTQLN